MAKWPDSFIFHAKGVGYGDYKGMSIEFDLRTADWDMCAYVFEAQITEK